MDKLMRKRGLLYAHILAALLKRIDVAQAEIVPVGVGARHLSLGVKLGNPLHLAKVQKLDDALALSARVNHCLATCENGLIVFQLELSSLYWQTITRDKLIALDLPTDTVGLAENRTGIRFSLNDAPHSLFAGTSGSGKSEAVKSALVGVANTYQPQRLQLVICDPNYDYEDFTNLAYLALPIANEGVAIEQALRWVNGQLAHRQAENIKDGPPLLVVIDEADSDVALKQSRNLEVVKNVAKVGRKYHVYLLIATQKPNHADFPNVLDNLLNRFVGLVSDPTMSYQLTGKGRLGAHLLTGAGDFLHCIGPTVKRFQVAMATANDYHDLPRAEISMPDLPASEIVTLSDATIEAPSKRVGRPPNQLVVKALAYYPSSRIRSASGKLRKPWALAAICTTYTSKRQRSL